MDLSVYSSYGHSVCNRKPIQATLRHTPCFSIPIQNSPAHKDCCGLGRDSKLTEVQFLRSDLLLDSFRKPFVCLFHSTDTITSLVKYTSFFFFLFLSILTLLSVFIFSQFTFLAAFFPYLLFVSLFMSFFSSFLPSLFSFFLPFFLLTLLFLVFFYW